jgi:predicted nuclease of restriction endonuclease-like RecB superfamily
VLTADLVNARRRGGDLCIVALDAAGRRRAAALAEKLVATTSAFVGSAREELIGALEAIDVGPREHRLRDGLVKLIEDRCEFDASDAADPPGTRREVFSLASAARACLPPGAVLACDAILAQVAARRGSSAEAIERALFADLRGAHVLTAFRAPSAAELVTCYEQAQAQAVLLRAVKVQVDVRCSAAGGLRALFRKLKFLRLLHTIEKTHNGHRIVIDGPFSLFESVTKYGLQLALVLPVLDHCDAWKLEADVRWGKQRVPLAFRLASGAWGAGPPSQADASAALPDEVQALVESFKGLETPWRVSVNIDILDLPGVGLSVPDLVFERKAIGAARDRIYLEVLGYWSRAAVWKRVELVEAGLPERILFAVSSRLRVSEGVLDGDLPGALYVYKAKMSARAVADRLERLAGRSDGGAP